MTRPGGIEVEVACHHAGRADGCLRVPDPRFDGTVAWCAICGPRWEERRALLERLVSAGFGPALEEALASLPDERRD